jgi:hypothetical protein
MGIARSRGGLADRRGRCAAGYGSRDAARSRCAARGAVGVRARSRARSDPAAGSALGDTVEALSIAPGRGCCASAEAVRVRWELAVWLTDGLCTVSVATHHSCSPSCWAVRPHRHPAAPVGCGSSAAAASCVSPSSLIGAWRQPTAQLPRSGMGHLMLETPRSRLSVAGGAAEGSAEARSLRAASIALDRGRA